MSTRQSPARHQLLPATSGTADCQTCTLLEVPAPFPLQNSRILLLEPTGSHQARLGEKVSDGTYDKPFILDHGALRFLHFELEASCAAMTLMPCASGIPAK
jgi:hypothetical protein